MEADFNSTLVRLKARMIRTRFPGILFQFHIGTIKRSLPKMPFLLPSNFNSTLVRLKERKNLYLRELPLNFNSTLVRLKELVWQQGEPDTKYFNSTLVRLKGLLTCRSNPCLTFQFHIGTIKRAEKAGRRALDLENFNSTLVRLKDNLAFKNIVIDNISIPHWYD